MNPAAIYLSVEVTRRSARSALPTAEVVPPGRWQRLLAALRAAARPHDTGVSAAIVPPFEVGVDTATVPPDEAGVDAETVPPDGRSG
jgi:hypothetical protein